MRPLPFIHGAPPLWGALVGEFASFNFARMRAFALRNFFPFGY